MTITSMLVVFSALVLLYVVFRISGKASAKISQRKRKSTQKGEAGTTTAPDHIPGEVLSAIFMALHEEQGDVHDVESTILTFNTVNKTYSPWSSKIYGLRELPRK